MGEAIVIGSLTVGGAGAAGYGAATGAPLKSAHQMDSDDARLASDVFWRQAGRAADYLTPRIPDPRRGEMGAPSTYGSSKSSTLYPTYRPAPQPAPATAHRSSLGRWVDRLRERTAKTNQSPVRASRESDHRICTAFAQNWADFMVPDWYESIERLTEWNRVFNQAYKECMEDKGWTVTEPPK